jgi:hypothetical protein
MKKIFLLTALCGSLFSSQLCHAQDTLKIGVNSEIIQVTPPELNHKVYVIIEDSTFNYHVDIYKLQKSSTLDYSNSLMDKNLKKKKYTSSLLNEIEFGISLIPKTAVHQINWASSSTFDHLTSSFMSNGENFGLYGSVNIRSKQRMLDKNKKVYFGNATQVKFNWSEYQGNTAYTEIFSRNNSVPRQSDSIGKIDTFPSRLDVTKWFFVKRLALGYVINERKNFSVEYGLDINVKFFSKIEHGYYNSSTAFIEKKEGAKLVENPFISDPTISLYHRIGVNYQKLTLNVGLSNGQLEVGSHPYRSGRALNVGLAYRIR